jgi:ferritin-like metal-binding protein YciE
MKGISSMQLDSLKALYIHELNDLHDAEVQLIQALPRMAAVVSSEDLRLTFDRRLDQTREHVRRLLRAFSRLKEKPRRVTCKAMKGILEDAEDMVKAKGDPAVKDAGLISAAQRVEHHEIAGYGCARTYADLLGQEDAAALHQQSLNDVRAMDEALSELATSLIHGELVYA